MADITNEIQKIGQAVYGEEVRGAIMDALEAMNEQAESAEDWATGGEGGTAAADNNAKYYAEQAAASAATFEVDDTLSVADKAADAAVVGARLKTIEDGYASKAVDNLGLAYGQIASNGSNSGSSKNYLRSTYFRNDLGDSITVTIPTGIKVYIHYYDESSYTSHTGTYLSPENEGWWIDDDSPVVVPVVRGKRMRFMAAKKDGTAFTSTTAPDGLSVLVQSYTDEMLTQPGKAADAEKTGAALDTKYSYRRLLNEEDDLNLITEIGAYRWVSSHLPANSPTSASAAMIVSGSTVESPEGKCQLIVTAAGDLFVRYGYATEYTEWTRFAKRDDMSDIGQAVNELFEIVGSKSLVASDGIIVNGYVTPGGNYHDKPSGSSSTTNIVEYTVDDNWKKIYVVGSSIGDTYISFLSASITTLSYDDPVPFAGEASRNTIPKNGSAELDIPDGCTHLVVQRYYTGYNRTPDKLSVLIEGIENTLKALEDKDDDLLRLITALSASVESSYASYLVNVVYENGNISSSSGGNMASTTRIRSKYTAVGVDGKAFITIPENKKVYIYKYDAPNISEYSGSYGTDWFHHGDSPVEVSLDAGMYIRFVIAYEDDSTIKVEDGGADGIEVRRNEYTDVTLSQSQKAADAKTTGDMIRGTVSAYDPADYSARNGNIGPTNKWTGSTSNKHSVIPITNERMFKLTSPEKYSSIFAFLTDDTVVSGQTPAFSEEMQGRFLLDPGKTAFYLVPLDAKYLYFYRGTSSVQNYVPAEIVAYEFGLTSEVLRAIIESAKTWSGSSQAGLTRDIPQSQGMRNAYKKMMQLQNVTYDVPVEISSRGQSPGSLSGIMYSGTADKAHYVGYNVSLRSYLTAIHNPYSGIYTEDVSSEDSESAYGIVYEGSNANIPLGIVCAPFVAWVLGMNVKWENHAWPYLERTGVMEKIADQSYSGVQLGDMMCYNGHAAIISDIYRDSRGEPKRIYITESKQPVVTTTEYTPSSFMTRMADHYHYENGRLVSGQILYRYKDLDKNLDYTPSEFVAVEDEAEPPAYVYNEDICPYLGDYSVYREGELIAVCYTKGNYSSMVIAKNGTDLHTITLASSADTHSIDLRSYNLTAGSYTARLTGSGVSDSAPCYFDVISLPISKSEDGDNITVTFDKTKKPRYIQVCIATGACFCAVPLTDEDKAAGSKTFNIREEYIAQRASGSSVIEDVPDLYAIVMYDVTDPAGYKLIRATEFVPLTWRG